MTRVVGSRSAARHGDSLNCHLRASVILWLLFLLGLAECGRLAPGSDGQRRDGQRRGNDPGAGRFDARDVPSAERRWQRENLHQQGRLAGDAWPPGGRPVRHDGPRQPVVRRNAAAAAAPQRVDPRVDSRQAMAGVGRGRQPRVQQSVRDPRREAFDNRVGNAQQRRAANGAVRRGPFLPDGRSDRRQPGVPRAVANGLQRFQQRVPDRPFMQQVRRSPRTAKPHRPDIERQTLRPAARFGARREAAVHQQQTRRPVPAAAAAAQKLAVAPERPIARAVNNGEKDNMQDDHAPVDDVENDEDDEKQRKDKSKEEPDKDKYGERPAGGMDPEKPAADTAQEAHQDGDTVQEANQDGDTAQEERQDGDHGHDADEHNDAAKQYPGNEGAEDNVQAGPTLSPDDQEALDRQEAKRFEELQEDAAAEEEKSKKAADRSKDPADNGKGAEGIDSDAATRLSQNVHPRKLAGDRDTRNSVDAARPGPMPGPLLAVSTDYVEHLPSLLELGGGSQLPPGHPRLLMDSKELQELTLHAQGSHARIFEEMQAAAREMAKNPKKFLPPVSEMEFASSWNEHYGNRLTVLALYSALSPDDTMAELLTIRALRRLISFSSWKVETAPGDDVPAAHTLLGVAIAYDLLFHKLAEYERRDMAQRIADETRRLQTRAQGKAGWNRQYLHNHMMTVQVALLAGALVTEHHARAPSLEQQALARLAMERCMLLLRHVPDGSLHEGVGYTSYSTRSLFLYIHLARRHYGATSHLRHPWLARHFTYLLATTLPGFRGSLGVADSDVPWFFGPEAQLYFLDKYVLHSGNANWLAAKIRSARGNALRPTEWSMLPFEMIWFAPHIGRRPPDTGGAVGLRVLYDWGLATYGGSSDRLGSSFLSLKSGYVLGRGLHEVASVPAGSSPYPFLDGMMSFNAGHEHPDQGSFTFYPHGDPFVTESLYFIPKLPHMDNTWLFRGGGRTGHSCTAGNLIGQLGGCSNWFQYKTGAVVNMSADIVTAETDQGMTMMMSESAGAYGPELGIRSVTRTVIMLREDTLLVVDCIRKTPNSPVLRGSAFFNNMHQPFSVESEDSTQATLSSAEGNTIQWILEDNIKSLAMTGTTKSAKLKHKRDGQLQGYYLNVSVPLILDTNHIAFLLTAGRTAADMEIISSSDAGVSLFVSLGGDDEAYSVSVVTNHSCLGCRYTWHGSGALAHVRHGNTITRFGTSPVDLQSAVDLDLRPMKSMLPSAINQQLFIYMCVSIIGWCLLMLVFFWRFKFLRQPRYLWPLGVCVLCWLAVLVVFLASHIAAQLPSSLKLQFTLTSLGKEDYVDNGIYRTTAEKPRVLVTGLPWGSVGRIVAEHLFNATPDAVFLPLSDLPMKGGVALYPLASCIWAESRSPLQALASSWLTQVFEQATSVLQHATEHRSPASHMHARSKLSADPSAAVIAGDMDGTWLVKGGWFLDTVHSGKVLLLVGDPRRWVADVMRTKTLLPGNGLSLQAQITMILKPVGSHCDVTSECARTFEPMRKLALTENQRPEQTLHKILSTIWLAYTKWALCRLGNSDSAHVLAVDRFAGNAVAASRKVFRFLGLPHRPAVSHHLRMLTKSGLGEFAELAADLRYNGTFGLAPNVIDDVQSICGELMDRLGYQRTRAAG